MRKLLTLLLLSLISLATQAAGSKPNILLIVLDDAGYSDIAGFGRNDAPTPNIENIAREGVRFTRHYADSTCRPARLALLTGREAARVAQNPDFRGISSEILTLPEALKNYGYSTTHIGKWHLGDATRASWPDQQGFDTWFGFLNQFQLKGPDNEGKFTRRPTYIDPWLQGNNKPLQPYHGHLEDILATHVVDAINNGAKKNQPWFINYWLFAPHHPSTASADFLKKFPDTPEGKYKALLAQADAEIGKVMQALRESHQLDNTLIIITSDNGGTNQMMNNNFPYAGVKGEFREGSLRTPLIIRWPDQRAAGKAFDDIVAIQDIYPTVLATIGQPVAHNIDGQDLQPLLTGKKLASRQLIHEIFNIGTFNYSLLSADGQWRATSNALYSLQADSSGNNNVIEKFPAQFAAMEKDYATWRNSKVRLNLQPVSSNEKKEKLQITGDDMRRAPGYGAFSFAIGAVMPKAGFAAPVYLTDQAGIWSLSYNANHTFTIKIGADTVTSLPYTEPENARCTPIVLSALYTRSRLYEGRNAAYIQLYAGSQKLLDWQQDNPAEFDGSWQEPTWIGSNSAGTNHWPERLWRPQLYNAVFIDQPSAAFDRLQDAKTSACQ